ncbi:MAG: hypothetical protein PUP92_30215 [Rhizonema sp. PD38]|nr:hypothetical protein [Rhizonema sp. PD38]
MQDLENLLGTNDPTKLDPQQLPTNDITAISLTSPTLSGQVNILIPDVDPNRGLVTLPTVAIALHSGDLILSRRRDAKHATVKQKIALNEVSIK